MDSVIKRYKVTVAYDGCNYNGWQSQPNVKSVQETIEKVLERIHQKPISITASGRTDAYVHALGQVFHFDTDKNYEIRQWLFSFNSMLPKDIRVQDIEEVKNDFHARFHAVSKRYDYVITYDILNPFLQNYAAKMYKPLNVESMRKCAEIFKGTHDFTTFTSSKIDERKSRVKTITRLDIVEEEKGLRFIFEGNGFLRYMVRMLSQTIIEAGKGNITPEDVLTMLQAKDKHICRFKAEPCGLYLVRVDYGSEYHES